jgi:hypothetical protein
MAKHHQCFCCGSVSRVLWIDSVCESCQSLRDLLLLLDATPLPYGVDFPARKELETRIVRCFAEFTERHGSAAVRARIASRGVNDWVLWYFEKWLAEREGREFPLEPNLFQAIRKQRKQRASD